MKKIIALIVAMVMVTGIFSAMGEGMGDELEAVALKVRETIGLDGDIDDFTGEKYSGEWFLDWTAGDRQISVICSQDGKIYSYYMYDSSYDDDSRYDAGFKPSFPGESEEIIKAAEEFAGRVMGEGESWAFSGMDSMGLDTGSGECTLRGRLVLEDMPTDIAVDMTVNTGTMEVTNYYRSDSYTRFEDAPLDSAVNSDAEAARQAILEKADLEIKYFVTDYRDMARLVYMPRSGSKYIVRASDGELINTDDAYEMLVIGTYEDGAAGDYMADMESAEAVVEISEEEKQVADQYEGAMDVDTLDALIRSMTELDVNEGYVLVSADYYFSESILLGSLYYMYELTDEEAAERSGVSVETIREMRGQGYAMYDNKRIEINAHDGSVEFFNFWRGGWGRQEPVEAKEGECIQIAEDFIKNYMGDAWEYIALYETSADVNFGYPMEHYNFVRVHDGYNFPENYVNITVNAETGHVEAVDKYWNNSQEFYEYEEAPISPEAALEAYGAAQEFECAYITLPFEMNDEYDIVNERVLAWHFHDPDYVYAVDAMTGEALSYGVGSTETFEYSDIEGIAQESKIKTLGEYGVGWSGGFFCPENEFTARDMLVLLLCMQGNSGVEYWDFEEAAMYAYDMGADDFSGEDPDAAIARAELVKNLMCVAGYGDAAQLGSIYSLEFADAGEIEDEDKGFIAIAAGLDIIRADAEGNVNVYDVLTRAEAAEIIYDFIAADK